MKSQKSVSAKRSRRRSVSPPVVEERLESVDVLEINLTDNEAVLRQIISLQSTVSGLQDSLEKQVENLREKIGTVQKEVKNLQGNVTKISTHLDSTQIPPIVTPPTPPVIGLSENPSFNTTDGTLLVSVAGRGFRASSDVVCISIKCSDVAMPSRSYSFAAGPSGNLIDLKTGSSPQIVYQPDTLKGQTYYLAATDETPNVEDWTGKLWSNTISFVW
jgi:hypothetical protein